MPPKPKPGQDEEEDELLYDNTQGTLPPKPPLVYEPTEYNTEWDRKPSRRDPDAVRQAPPVQQQEPEPKKLRYRDWNPEGWAAFMAAAAAQKGGGGGGGGGGTPKPKALPGADVEDEILGYLRDVMGGKFQPYTDERIGALKHQAFSTLSGQEQAKLRESDEDLVGRGLYRSGIAAGSAQNIRNAKMAAYGQATTGIQQQAVEANYQSRIGSLDRMQKWLDQKRDYLLRKEGNEIAREVGMAQINLGYAKISAEKEMLQMQLSRMGGGGTPPSKYYDPETGLTYELPEGY